MPGYELSSADRSVIDKKNLCPKCEGLLREAVQTIACGHRYCKTCVETILRSVRQVLGIGTSSNDYDTEVSGTVTGSNFSLHASMPLDSSAKLLIC